MVYRDYDHVSHQILLEFCQSMHDNEHLFITCGVNFLGILEIPTFNPLVEQNEPKLV